MAGVNCNQLKKNNIKITKAANSQSFMTGSQFAQVVCRVSLRPHWASISGLI